MVDRFAPSLSNPRRPPDHPGEIRRCEGVKLTWVGDGNNVANSWLQGLPRWACTWRWACPKGYWPPAELTRKHQEEAAAYSGSVEIMEDPFQAVKGADVIYTMCGSAWPRGGTTLAAGGVSTLPGQSDAPGGGQTDDAGDALPTARTAAKRLPLRSSTAPIDRLRPRENRLHTPEGRAVLSIEQRGQQSLATWTEAEWFGPVLSTQASVLSWRV